MEEPSEGNVGGMVGVDADQRRPILIVNADDFGMTDGVSTGILRAHRDGVVTSTSALVVGSAFERHASSLRDSGLSVGAHLALVGEDPPLLSAREIPSLLDRSGRFPLTWQAFVRRGVAGVLDPDDLRRELTAQLDRLRGVGIEPTHLDSHQNLHLWPEVATVLLSLAEARRIGAIRLCRAGRWNATGLGVRALSSALARRAARSGIAFPEASTNLDDATIGGRSHLVAVIDRMAARRVRSAEIVTHLGEEPDSQRARYRSRFDWPAELQAVCEPAVRRAIEAGGFRLGSFADLATAPSARAS